MKLHEELHPLAWGHRTALTWCLHLKRDTPGLTAKELREWTAKVDKYWHEELRFQLMAEEDCLLPRLKGKEGATELIGRSMREHNNLERLLYRAGTSDDEALIRQHLCDFGEALEAHIRFEEQVVFQRAQEVFDDAELAAVGLEVRELGVGIDEPYLPNEKTPRDRSGFHP